MKANASGERHWTKAGGGTVSFSGSPHHCHRGGHGAIATASSLPEIIILGRQKATHVPSSLLHLTRSIVLKPIFTHSCSKDLVL